MCDLTSYKRIFKLIPTLSISCPLKPCKLFGLEKFVSNIETDTAVIIELTINTIYWNGKGGTKVTRHDSNQWIQKVSQFNLVSMTKYTHKFVWPAK